MQSVAGAGLISETREAKASFTLSGKGDIEVKGSDRYVTISSWEKNEVEITARVEFKGRQNEKVDEFLDNFEDIVNGSIRKIGNSIWINTNLDEPNKVEIKNLFKFVVIEYGNDELFISYDMKVPENADLEVENSYEDLYVTGSYTGRVEIDHYSGDLSAGDFNELELTLKYGDAEINSVKSSEMTLYEQRLNIGSAGNGVIEAKYSDLEFSEAGKIEFDTYETDIKIKTIRSVAGEMKYGELEVSDHAESVRLSKLYENDLEFGDVNEILIRETKYGSVIGKYIGNLIIDYSYEDKIEVNRCGQFKFNGKYTKIRIDQLEGALSVDEGYETEVTISKLNLGVTDIFMDGKYNTLEIYAGDIPLSLDMEVRYADLDYPSNKFKRQTYIKDGSELKVELVPITADPDPVIVTVRGYETELDIE